MGSLKSFARGLLDVDGNMNQAMKTMDLTNDQINQLLPMVAQFAAAAGIFGLAVPAWMKSFVTEQLGVDWNQFQETAMLQANAGIVTVEKLDALLTQNK
ncbi:unnamed protein product, partial [marine sediment metagenome]